MDAGRIVIAVGLASLLGASSGCGSAKAEVSASGGVGDSDFSLDAGVEAQVGGGAEPASPEPSTAAPPPATTPTATTASPSGPQAVPEDPDLPTAPGGTPVATLPGFHSLGDGRSVVYLELSGRVPVTESRAEGRLSYHLPGVGVPARTNRFDLPTSQFSTPVGHIRLVPGAGGADLIVELRAPAEPSARLARSGRGVVLRIEFPFVSGVRVDQQVVLGAEEPEASPKSK